MTTWTDVPVPTPGSDGSERRQPGHEPVFAQILATLFPRREPAPEQVWIGPCDHECDHELEAG